MYTPDEMAAFKSEQKARLALKGTPGYSAALESTPVWQKRRAELQAERRKARASKRAAASQAAKDALSTAEALQQFVDLEA